MTSATGLTVVSTDEFATADELAASRDSSVATSSTQNRVVVGVDGSPSSIHALRWAETQARLNGSPLQVVAAWQPSEFALELASSGRETQELRFRQLLLAQLVTHVLGETPGVRVEIDVIRGSPVPVLLEAADDAALLVLGERGNGGFAGLELGSVGVNCTVYASCSVVIVKEDQAFPSTELQTKVCRSSESPGNLCCASG